MPYKDEARHVPGGTQDAACDAHEQDEGYEWRPEHHLPARANAAPHSERARVPSVGEAACGHRAQRRVVGEPRRRPGVDHESQPELAEPRMRLDLPERCTLAIPDSPEGLQVIRGVVARDLGGGTIRHGEPGRIPQIERRPAGGAGSASNAEPSARADRAGSQAVEKCSSPARLYDALPDREGDHTPPRFADARAPQCRDEAPDRQRQHAHGRSQLARDA